MAKFCCVCSESKEAPDNQLFCCKGHGCDVTVHQACYGIVSIPSGLWFCRKCESQERAARVRCELCPRKEGALKRTDSGGWAHVVCALYIPEVTFGNNVRMEPIITSKLPRERFSKSCYLCEDQGLETQAGHGACMACHKSGCRLAFHVTCAQKERLLCEEEDSRDTRNIVYCGYCMVHFKKMIRQKYKQTLRKQPPTPTSSTAPPLPPTPTATTADTPSTPLPQLPSLPATKEPFERREAPKPIKKEKQKADLPQKRTSMDAPIPPPKQRKRRRKVSSSNESTTSETPSHASDIHHHLASSINANAPASPSLPATRSPLTVSEQALVGKPPKEVSESGSNEFLASSKDSQSLSLLPPHPLSPVSAALGLPVSSGGGGQFSMDVATGSRQTGSTSSDQSSASRAQAPPLSLHELLERQWEQTAQYILDQAGRQNNAGVMLAHLHQLQSENQRMQARIMELASQREFYIATNTRLSQTLAEQDGGRLPNGVQPPGEGIQQALQMAASSSSPSNGESTNRTLGASDTQGDSDHRHPVVVVSSSLPKAAQDSLLQAHFMATSLPQYRASSSSSSSKNTSVTTGTHKKEGSSKHHRSSQGGSQPDSRSRSTQELLQASAGGLRLENERSIQQQQQQPGGNHEITYVTNSIQAPITTYTPLPSDRSFLDSGSSWLFNRNGSSNPRSKS